MGKSWIENYEKGQKGGQKQTEKKLTNAWNGQKGSKLLKAR